jgi:peptidoglycan-N-acetylglucosamine deacetylase
MKLEFSFDDGDELDTKVIQLLDKYGFQATFYIPVFSWGFDHLEAYKKHIVGAHSISHPQDMKELDDEAQDWQIKGSKTMLEDKLQKDVTSFCYPRGRYNESTIRLVKDAGFVEARTTSVLFTRYDDPFRKPTTIHLYPNRREYEGKTWTQWANFLFEGSPEYFHVWGHSWEVQKYNEWDNFEAFLKRAHEHRNTSSK